MKKQIFLTIMIGLLIANVTKGQIDKFNTIDLHPVSPTAFQFLKYTEMPVSEYTGIPNINVPFYQVNVDEVSIPLQLTYHAAGIRVSQEASWVGLGWDLQLGSIVQQINDKDDYGTYYAGNYIKRRPDFFTSNGDGSPNILPIAWLLPGNTPGYGWYSPYPITQPQEKQGFAIATGNYIPVGGQFAVSEAEMLTSEYYDSEPDIFSANFLGHSVKFTLNFLNSPNSNHIVVLTKGYKVIKTTDGYKIITPDGTSYFFELKSSITNFTASNNLEGTFYSGNNEPTSYIFFLTKIVTVKGKTITIDYWQTAKYAGYPSASEKLQSLSSPSTNSDNYAIGNGLYRFVNFDGRSGFPGSTNARTYSENSESYFYLKSITFPNGKVDFGISDRQDITGGKKLDEVVVRNSNDIVVKSWQLNYSYFDATSVTGNGYGYNNSGAILGLETRSVLRLKLNNVADNSGAVYSFTYNSTLLPKKNSYAQDYWGFYNGQLANTSLIPDPATLNLSSLGSNGNNKNADLQYTKAGILEEIKYPTGGRVAFEYELHEFDKYQMIGLPSANSTVQGSGLRIHAISHFTGNNSAQPATKTVYSYEGGKLIHPVEVVRTLSYSVLIQANVNQMISNSHNLTEISANGVFTSNPLSSVNGVGYTKVTRQNINGNNANGKIVTEFYNNIAVYNPSISGRALNCHILFLKSRIIPDNGSDSTISIYDDQDRLLKRVKKSYGVRSSEINYGARIMPYGRLCYQLMEGNYYSVHYMPQYIVGYYPIFDTKTLLSSTTTTEYDENNNSLVAYESFGYDALDQLGVKHIVNSDSREEITFIHAYNDISIPEHYSLYANNRLTEVVKMTKYKRDINYSNSRLLVNYDKQYSTSGSNIVVNQSSIDERPGNNPAPVVTTYDLYDNLANLLQYTKAGETNSYLWGYNQEYVVAEVKNASHADIAYTSFESDEKGNWDFSGTPFTDVSAPTGKMIYSLNSGSLSRNSLGTSLTYIVSYWKSGGLISVNGTTPVAGRTVGNWTYYEHKVVNPSGGTITLSGTGTIDEVRLYPETAQMISYTFEPLIGMTSQCDANNRITYYEYDAAKRLSAIRDQDKNLVRKICYNYSGQPEPCNAVLYGNAIQSTDFTRTDCGSSYTGGTVTYTVPGWTYTSTISQEDANQQAVNDVNANGQAYANANGTCTPINPVTITLRNLFSGSLSFPDGIRLDFMQGSSVVQTNYFPSGNGKSSVNITLPAGTYQLRFRMPLGFSTYHIYYGIKPPAQTWDNGGSGLTLTTGNVTFSTGTIYIIWASSTP